MQVNIDTGDARLLMEFLDNHIKVLGAINALVHITDTEMRLNDLKIEASYRVLDELWKVVNS